jgi:hypothetical protein
MRSSLIQKFGAALGLLAFSAFVPAQAADKPAEKPQYLLLTTFHVKPGADADFADLLKNHWYPAMKKAGASPQIYSATPAGGRAGTYVIASQVHSLAIFDGKTALSSGAGDVEAAHIIARRANMIEDRSETIMRRRPEMSVYRETPESSPLILVQHVTVAPGKMEEYQAVWNGMVLPAVKKSGHFVSTWRVALGEDTRFDMVTPLSKFAELDKGFSVAQMSMTPEEYAALNAKVGGLFTNMRREVLRLRKDLMVTQ